MQSDTLLGTGAFGAVYLGVHDSTGEMVAIKKVRLGADSDDARKQVELLVCEIKLMKQLEHPNVVRYLHAERQGDCLCIFMEYMAGGSLNGLLKKFGKLSPNVVKVYMRHSLEGIAYLHRRNIVHRDIKPDNILLASSGDAKLSDFGTSREFNDSANLLTVTGTPWFMAPEVVKGSGHGAAADMWSVGCTMLQLVTGKAPMEEFPNPVTAMYQIATHPEKVMQLIPASLSSECADVIRACLHEDPMQRATAPQLLSFPYFLEEAPPGPLRPATAPASRQQPLRAPDVPATSTVVRRPSGAVGAGGAVPAVPQLPLNAPVDGTDGHNEAGSRPGTPTIGTPRSFATRLREQTQHEQ
jgi:serine/threonine protein kinase